MKELTIEQKAKAYDEALKRAIKHHNKDSLTLEQYETIDIIFPELKESKENKDERIRKALINIFATHKDYEVYFGVSVEDIRVWLEKQGEQKVSYTTIVETGNGGINALVTRELPIEMKTPEESLGIDSETCNEIVNDCINCENGKLREIEQKPIWTAEDDEKILKSIEQCVYNNVINIGTVNKVRYIDWLKALKERYTWKPSDEHIKVLDEVLNFAANHESTY